VDVENKNPVAGLDPATQRSLPPMRTPDNARMIKGGWVYIMTNRPNGTLYVGTTSDLARRAWEHRNGVADGFTKQNGLKRLVYAERYDDILSAKQRERNIKHWPRAWKIDLILRDNPNWDDLYDRLV
jgi:putative endonuclease